MEYSKTVLDGLKGMLALIGMILGIAVGLGLEALGVATPYAGIVFFIIIFGFPTISNTLLKRVLFK